MAHTNYKVIAALSIWLALLTAQSFPVTEQKFIQDRFVISFWVDPEFGSDPDARYREVAEANFNLVLSAFNARTPEQTKTVLDLCQKYDMKAIIRARQPNLADTDPYIANPNDRIISADNLPEHPACWGYLVKDEPQVHEFLELKKRVDAIHEKHPGEIALVNLFPGNNQETTWGADSYYDYLDRAAQELNQSVLCMDHYPVMKPDEDTREEYLFNLDMMRQVSQKHNIPFWNFFNCMPFSKHLTPTEAQLNWQIYSSLAYGAKGVLYFCYWTPISSVLNRGYAIIRPDGTRTPQYEQAKRINEKLKKLGPTLMQLTSSGVIRIKPGVDVDLLLKDSPIKKFIPDEVNDYLIGVFKHSDGRMAILLNNYSYSYITCPTVALAVEMSKAVEVCQETGQEISVRDDNPGAEGFQISLQPGSGRLFLLPSTF